MKQKNKVIDPTGAILAPGRPKECQGNGEHKEFECCCDECDYFLLCFPEYEKGVPDDEECSDK